MPAKIMLPSTLTCARPPRTRPTSSCVKSKMRCVIPPVFIRLPARMKNGIASSGNDVVAEYIRCAIITSMSGPPIESMMSVAGQRHRDGDRQADQHQCDERGEDGDDGHGAPKGRRVRGVQ